MSFTEQDLKRKGYIQDHIGQWRPAKPGERATAVSALPTDEVLITTVATVKKKPAHPESKLQKCCVKWFRSQHPALSMVLFAIPNGGARGKREAKIMYGEGVVSGVADLFLAVPEYNFNKQVIYHGFFIEMKANKNTLTANQKKFKEHVIEHGYKFEVCRSLDQFMNLISEYLYENA